LARSTLPFRWSSRKPTAALSPRFSRKVTFQVRPAAKATPLPEASFRRTRLPTDARVSGDCPVIRTPVLEPLRSFSAMVFESLPSRSRTAAALHSIVGGAQRTVRCTWFLITTFLEERQRLMPQPVLPRTTFSAR
jgi:hypothetical protein